MNRENKKKSFEKNYYKTHPCNESFVCKVCGKTVVPTGAGSDHRNHCPYCLSSQRPGGRLRRCDGADSGMGKEEWRMGYYSSLQGMWDIKFQSHRSG